MKDLLLFGALGVGAYLLYQKFFAAPTLPGLPDGSALTPALPPAGGGDGSVVTAGAPPAPAPFFPTPPLAPLPPISQGPVILTASFSRPLTRSRYAGIGAL